MLLFFDKFLKLVLVVLIFGIFISFMSLPIVGDLDSGIVCDIGI